MPFAAVFFVYLFIINLLLPCALTAIHHLRATAVVIFLSLLFLFICLYFICCCQDDAAFRRFISLRPRTRLLEWATPSTMRRAGELAVADGVSYAEGVRLSVSGGLVAEEGASKFIHDLRRCDFFIYLYFFMVI